jgi:hypothetical protein
MANSVMDSITGPTNAGWSFPGWTSQQLVSGSVVLTTGGTYEVKAPTREDVPENSAKKVPARA